MPMLRETTEKLLCRLTPDEFIARASALARVVQDMHGEEQRQTDMKAQMKAAIASLDAERDQLSLVVSRSAELRDVRVTEDADYARGIAITWRTDTGEEVRRRPLSDQERQIALPGVTA